MSEFTLIDDERLSSGNRIPIGTTTLEVERNGARVLLPPDGLERALGWSLKEQGLCRGEGCPPVPDSVSLTGENGGVDLAALASLLGRPLAIDQEEGVALLGTGIVERAHELDSLEAPDFELPDLSGRMHRLSDYRGKKVLLIAYASW